MVNAIFLLIAILVGFTIFFAEDETGKHNLDMGAVRSILGQGDQIEGQYHQYTGAKYKVGQRPDPSQYIQIPYFINGSSKQYQTDAYVSEFLDTMDLKPVSVSGEVTDVTESRIYLEGKELDVSCVYPNALKSSVILEVKKAAVFECAGRFKGYSHGSNSMTVYYDPDFELTLTNQKYSWVGHK